MFLWWYHVPWFFMFPENLHCCLCIWRRSDQLQCLLTDFGREISYIIPIRDSEAFSDFSMHTPAPYFFIPSRRGILKIGYLFFILQNQLGSDHLPFASPRVLLSMYSRGSTEYLYRYTDIKISILSHNLTDVFTTKPSLLFCYLTGLSFSLSICFKQYLAF